MYTVTSIASAQNIYHDPNPPTQEIIDAALEKVPGDTLGFTFSKFDLFTQAHHKMVTDTVINFLLTYDKNLVGAPQKTHDTIKSCVRHLVATFLAICPAGMAYKMLPDDKELQGEYDSILAWLGKSELSFENGVSEDILNQLITDCNLLTELAKLYYRDFISAQQSLDNVQQFHQELTKRVEAYMATNKITSDTNVDEILRQCVFLFNFDVGNYGEAIIDPYLQALNFVTYREERDTFKKRFMDIVQCKNLNLGYSDNGEPIPVNLIDITALAAMI
jgi:hypothetical protein